MEFDIVKKYIEDKNREYLESIKIEDNEYLEELYQLFISDGISDKELIDVLITSYRYNISVNPLIVNEIKKLIKIKEYNYEFFLQFLSKDSCYFESGRVIGIPSIFTINHEVGHALYRYATNWEVPNNYNEIINRSDFQKKVNEISLEIEEKSKKVKDKSIQIVEKYLREIFCEYKENPSKFYDGNSLVFSINGVEFAYSKDEVSFEKILEDVLDFGKISELEDTVWKYEYDTFVAIQDIMDAVSVGKLCDSDIVKYGHGSKYYNSGVSSFEEIIANYSVIIKSKNKIEGIKMLKYYVGEELVDLLEEFYNNRILDDDRNRNMK